ncbi:MAG: lysophospholipid acyltransferase family protein [Bacillota bacterium]|jgi:1-acyl-sn-glycerol-3-phosphate acyltransferase
MYRFCKKVLQAFFALFAWRIVGIENLPAGACVVACNHISFWDGPLLWAAIEQKAYFMAKSELFRRPLIGKILSWAGAFAVRRGKSDRSAINKALGLVKKGKKVVVYIPGTRIRPGKKLVLKNGAAMIAIRGRVPIVPVAIMNSDRMFAFKGRRARPTIVFGKPIDPQTQLQLQALQTSDAASSLTAAAIEDENTGSQSQGNHGNYEALVRTVWREICALQESL